MQRIQFNTDRELLASMREEDEYEFSQVEAEEGHPVYSLWLFVRGTEYDLEDGMVKFRQAIIPQEDVFGCIMLYVQYLAEQPWKEDKNITFIEYGNMVGFSHDKAMDWEKYIPYRVKEEDNQICNGQGKLLVAQLESFPTDRTESHNVVVFGSNSGLVETGLSYPAIARLVSPHVSQGSMHLYDIMEVSKVEQEGSYTINHSPLDLTYDTMSEIVSRIKPDDIIYDIYDEDNEYISIQESMVMTYPYRRHLLKIPSVEVANRIKVRFSRKGIYSRIIDQVYYDGREVRMQVSKNVIPETLKIYSLLTSMYPSDHSCYACKRIHLMAYRHNIEVDKIYDELQKIGIRPCTKYPGQRMIRKINMVRRYLGSKFSYDYDNMVRFLMQHDLYITPLEANLVTSFLKKTRNRRKVKQGDIYRKDMPQDYKEMFRCFPMGRVCVRMVGDFLDHWSFSSLYADQESVVAHVDFSSKKRLVYEGISTLDHTRCIAFPEGVGKYTRKALQTVVDMYQIRNMYMTRHIVVRDIEPPEIDNFFKLFSINGRGYSTAVYKRKNDYTDDKGNTYAIYKDHLYYNGKEIDKMCDWYGFVDGEHKISLDRCKKWIDLNVPYNRMQRVRLYATGGWEYLHEDDTDSYMRLKYALRHTSEYIDDKGWAEIHEIENKENLQISELQQYNLDDFNSRYEIQDGYIRSYTGHTVDINVPRYLIKGIEDVPYGVVVHGTYEHLLSSIKTNGLVLGTRLEIHFSISSKYIQGKSGLKKDVEILVYLDYEKYLKDGYLLYMAANGTILATDVVQPQYILKCTNYKTGLPV